MLGYILLVLTTVAGLLNMPWQFAIFVVATLTLPTLYRQLAASRDGGTAVHSLVLLSSLVTNALFTLAAFALGHGIALLSFA
jgi:hypothetical protein